MVIRNADDSAFEVVSRLLEQLRTRSLGPPSAQVSHCTAGDRGSTRSHVRTPRSTLRSRTGVTAWCWPPISN